MDMRRRDLLKALAGSAALVACGAQTPSPASPAPSPSSPPAPAPRAKRILVLGGTGYAGPPIVNAAREHGHTVTLFNRGKSNPGLFPDVETILGDRMTQLDLLRGREWDAVVDTWAPGPTLVRRAGELLRDHVGQYVFVSTISVYKLGKDPLDESSPVLTLPPGLELKDIHAIDEKVYGPLKALAEQAAESAMPGRTTSVRAGVIAGPNDPTDRFTHWPVRMARGGEVMAPGSKDDRMTFIDARDLGEWIVRTIEDKTFGVYNAVGPTQPALGTVLEDIRAGVKSDARLTWVDQAWLDENELSGWESFPLAVPSGADDSGFGKVSAARAIAKGLRFRPVGETARDTLAWWNAQPEERRTKKRPGLSPEREAELLAKWHAAKG
jgi:2'-hydroxyisoflavone reductase